MFINIVHFNEVELVIECEGIYLLKGYGPGLSIKNSRRQTKLPDMEVHLQISMLLRNLINRIRRYKLVHIYLIIISDITI